MAGVLVGMVFCWGIIGLLVFSRKGYRRFAAARADGQLGIAPFAVYFVCGTIGFWLLGTIVYFGLGGR